MISIGNLQINKLCLGDVEVTKAYLGDVEVYGSTPEPTVEKYMTMTVGTGTKGTTISPTVTGSLPNLNLQYRVNNGNWSDFVVGTTADIHAVAGDIVQFKGVNPAGLSVDSSNYMNFSISGNPVALSGNVMSLIDGVGYALEIPCNYCFYKMFAASKVKTVSSDFLPATTLTSSCYKDLFSNCRILTQAPALPATTLTNMCYNFMYYNCTALKKSPDLNAKVLVGGCYGYMFSDCYSLNYVKCLAEDGISSDSLNNWLDGVSSSGTFVKPSVVNYETGPSGIPSGWTIQNI